MIRRQRAAGSGRPRALTREELVRAVGARLAASGFHVSLAAVEVALREVLAQRGMSWEPTRLRRAARVVTDQLEGLGPIGPLVRDPEISEIMINSPDEVFVERAGSIERAAVSFRSEGDLLHLIERIVSPLGLRVDVSSPWVDARLPDGSRLHAVVAPVAVRGPVVTIRKFGRSLWTLEDLVEMGSVEEPCACRLADAVRERTNLLVSGGAGSGKTTLLGVLARLVPARERIITIEDAAELRLGPRHVVALETRPPNVEGRGEVTMRDLVRCAMRMRPDRIVVGEVRGVEALDMLQALNSGHAGSMATIHANSGAEALVRLEALALMAAPGLSVEAARLQVVSAVDAVVHLSRDASGKRRVAEILDVEVKDRTIRPTRARRGSG